MPKPGMTKKWTTAAAKKLKGKSIDDLKVLSVVQYISDEENSDMVFNAAITALYNKSKDAFREVFKQLAEMGEPETMVEQG